MLSTLLSLIYLFISYFKQIISLFVFNPDLATDSYVIVDEDDKDENNICIKKEVYLQP